MPTLLRVPQELARHRRRADDQLRPEPPLDPRRAAPDRRPLRRGRRRARGGRSATCTPASRRTWSRRRWWKAITYPERIDYVSFQNNELVFVLAIEKLLGLETPPKATWMRTLPLRAEPHPLAPRLARHVGARARGDLDVLVLLPRARADPRPVRDGLRARACTRATSRPAGSPRTSRAASTPRRGSSSSGCRRRSTSTRRCVDRNKIWLERTVGLGLLSADDAIALGQSGPVLRASGVDWDLRKRAALPRLRRVRLRRARLPRGRRLRALPRAHGGDARVGARSSRSASTGSRRWRASRGSPTTARSCCRRARSSTPRWSR